MSTLVTIQSTDLITNSRADINGNFNALNNDKMETSVLDTDSTLAANSDAKIPSQKAVKAYVDAGGNVNASTTVKGIVEEADATETNAGTAIGGTGARLYVNPSNLAGYLANATVLTKVSSGQTSYDLSTASGDQNIAHGLGVSPRLVKVSATFATSSGHSQATALYSSSTQSSMSLAFNDGIAPIFGQYFRLYADISGTPSYQEGVITVTSTNIVITWTKTSTPTGTAYIQWEAFA